MLAVGCGLMNLYPDKVFVSLDGENAFGLMQRASMLRSTTEHCPEHAKFLACMWVTSSSVYVEESTGTWVEVTEFGHQLGLGVTMP